MSPTTRLRVILSGVTAAAYLFLTIGAHAQNVNEHAVVHDDRHQPVYDAASGTCVRTKWHEGQDECAPRMAEPPIQKEVHRVTISQDERTVYFPFNSAAVTPEAMSHLDTLAQDIKSQNDIKGARVVGFADRIGTPSYNEKLSQKRAEAVKNYLAAKGIVNASVGETRWFGSSMPMTDCPGTLSRPALIQCLQKDRHVEVEIDYTSEVVATQ